MQSMNDQVLGQGELTPWIYYRVCLTTGSLLLGHNQAAL